MQELPSSREIMLLGVGRMFRFLCYTPNEPKSEYKIVSSILIVLVCETVKLKDFSVIKVIRRELSSLCSRFYKSSADLDVFVAVSLFLYYLCNSDSEVPSDLKEDIQAFINEGGMVEENTRIISWRELFTGAADRFYVDYNNFTSLILEHSHNMEYWLNGVGARFVALDHGYITKWYFLICLTSMNFEILTTAHC